MPLRGGPTCSTRRLKRSVTSGRSRRQTAGASQKTRQGLLGRAPGRAPGRASARGPQDARGTAAAILELVDTDAPPLRLFLGTSPYPVVEAAYRKRLDTWNDWRHLASRA
ncbi:hypothetical protein ABZ719_36035 [Streptomyces sp. NPDC006743]|uniref:hypothetical protein n=1 Tax=Streptomyces sp. NPDC006743 TaxID=3154480 RepID=UPI003456AC53